MAQKNTPSIRAFYLLLINNLVASTTTSFIWFALTFWVYLGTRSVIASSLVGAMFPLFSSALGVIFGTFVDHHRRRTSMLVSSALSLGLFFVAGIIFLSVGPDALLSLRNPLLYAFIASIMAGAVASSLRMITLSTLVTLLVPESQHDRANGLVGTVNGVSLAVTSVFSGLAIAYLGMGWSLLITILFTLISVGHLLTIGFDDPLPKHSASKDAPKGVDFVGAFRSAQEVPGLLSLVFFTMINNFFGGAFFALMDPYGLELVSVQTWGFIWGGLSFCFILGGLLVSRFGLGEKPLRRMFIADIAMWTIALIFPLRASIVLLVIGMFFYMLLVPMIEAAE